MPTYSKAIKLSTPNSNVNYRSVVFHASPEISEARSVSYAEISDLRLPSSILIWMGSPSRNFNINARMIARSVREADSVFRDISLLKGWCITVAAGDDAQKSAISERVMNTSPVYNQDPKSPGDDKREEQDGAAVNTAAPSKPLKPFNVDNSNLFSGTPPVLLLEGYGNQFRRIPVVITSLNITFPSDVDYIKSTKGAWVPIFHEISISLKEAREVQSLINFRGPKLAAFKEGTLDNW